MAPFSRTALLASAAVAVCLALNSERTFVTAQLVPTCYANAGFAGTPQEVTSEADCRAKCAASKFASIHVTLLGTTVHGICRCGDKRPTESPSGVCSTPCSGGGICGGTGVDALLEISSTAPVVPTPAATNPSLPIPVNGTTTTPRLPGRTVKAQEGKPTTGATPREISPIEDVHEAPAASGGEFPTTLLPTIAIVLSVIVVVPFLVVSCLRFQRRRAKVKQQSETPYSSTRKRMRPVSATMFHDEPAPFPEMRASPYLAPVVNSPNMGPYRLRSDMNGMISPGLLSPGLASPGLNPSMRLPYRPHPNYVVPPPPSM